MFCLPLSAIDVLLNHEALYVTDFPLHLIVNSFVVYKSTKMPQHWRMKVQNVSILIVGECKVYFSQKAKWAQAEVNHVDDTWIFAVTFNG